MELLSPAGNLESLKAAVYNGANAVYFGLPNFNARKMADNFSLENLNETVEFCHLYNVKAYLAINTLIMDSEMQNAINFVRAGINAKVDAFIVADLGLANILVKTFKNIVLHASTQMGIHNLYGAKIAEKMGFKRVILSRETSLLDIKSIKQNTNLEIEFFVQGALCVAFSGNCGLSNQRCEKSGNRGECTQPCRLAYSLQKDGINVNQGKLLSCRDLCLIKNLKTLSDAGVDSFKIEGRNKRSSYVATVTKSYSKAIASIANNNPINLDNEMFNISKVFNRGEFNETAYLYWNKKEIINPKTSGHCGIFIGKVIGCEKFKNIYRIKIDTKHKLETGDGLKFFSNGKEMFSLGVGNVDTNGSVQTIYSTNFAKAMQDVFLTLDSKTENEALAFNKKLNVSLKAKLESNSQGELELSCNNISVTVKTESILDKAEKQPVTEIDLRKVFEKNKETVFNLSKIDLNTNGVFVPVSVLNKLKTNLYLQLKLAILDNYNKQNLKEIIEEKIDFNDFLRAENEDKNNNIFSNIAVVDAVQKVGLAGNSYNYIAFNGDIGLFKEFYSKVVRIAVVKRVGLVLPIFATKNDILAIQETIKDLDKNKLFLIANNLYGLAFIDEGYEVFAGNYLNIFNSYSAKVITGFKVLGFTFASELKEKGALISGAFEITGYLPLMNFSHCPFLTAGGDCSQCKYFDNATLTSEDNYKYLIKRQRCASCSFTLISENEAMPYTNQFVIKYFK